MITIQLADSTPYAQEGMAVKKLGDALPELPEEIENEICPFVFGGVFEYCVFVHSDATDWKNDKSEFMFKRFISTDTLNIELWKGGSKVADLNSNTYGTYFPTFSGTAGQQLQRGYLIEWLKVFNVFGYGQYTVRAQMTILGTSSTWQSDIYNVLGYSQQRANRTVSIVSTQNGNIMSSIFDYTDLQWHQQIRLKGTFYEDEETFEKNTYRTQNYVEKQIQDEIIENWSLELDVIPRDISEFLIKDRLLSNQFNVSDYTILNEKVHELVGVYPESIEKTRLIDNRNSNYLIKFTSKLKNVIKRNF